MDSHGKADQTRELSPEQSEKSYAGGYDRYGGKYGAQFENLTPPIKS